MSDRFNALRSKIDDRAKQTDRETFEFSEEGEVLVGELIGKRMVSSKFKNGNVPVIQLDSPDHGLVDVWPNVIMTDQLKAAGGVDVGDLLAIRFDGEKDTGKGNPAKFYTVVVDSRRTGGDVRSAKSEKAKQEEAETRESFEENGVGDDTPF